MLINSLPIIGLFDYWIADLLVKCFQGKETMGHGPSGFLPASLTGGSWVQNYPPSKVTQTLR
jgi:hypothetical protein